MPQSDSKKSQSTRLSINEDWLSVIIALLVILLSVIGVLGPHGIKITF